VTVLDTLQRRVPTSVEGHFERGLLESTRGRPEDALLAFRRVLELQPNDPVANASVGRALEELDRCNDALPYYDAAARIAPQSALGWGRVATCNARLGRVEPALAAWRKALERDPNYWSRVGKAEHALFIQLEGSKP
jgi:tetratricopeptide (TPR) repeat protein